jgi:molecular chaperone GrpE (heat shock protein)
VALKEVMGDIHRLLRERMTRLGKESFLAAFEGQDASGELFRMVRGTSTALSGMERVNFAELDKRAEAGWSAAEERWLALRSELDGRPRPLDPEELARAIARADAERAQLTGNAKGLAKLLLPQLGAAEMLRTTVAQIARLCADQPQDSTPVRFANDLAALYQGLTQRLDDGLPQVGLKRLCPRLGDAVNWSTDEPSEAREDTTLPEGVVVEVIQSGYSFIPTGEVLQMSNVVVTSHPKQAAPAPRESSTDQPGPAPGSDPAVLAPTEDPAAPVAQVSKSS